MTGIVVCYAKCWPCQFGECPAEPHTWMDSEDMEHADVAVPDSPEGWARLAAEKPCGCWCMKKHREQPPAEGGGEADKPNASDLGKAEGSTQP